LSEGEVLTSTGQDILLIDGYCGLCSRIGKFLEKRLSKSTPLRIIAQQEDDGVKVISLLSSEVQDLDSVLLIRNGTTYYYSSAGIRCLLYLKWWWKMWYPLAWIIPLPIRNILYMIVSKSRSRTSRTDS
jgi:predicted DCC family thiol-disulfide oxidoreductase YuxK